MEDQHRQKWDRKWAAHAVGTTHRSSLVNLVTSHVSGGLRLLDVAGGGSSNAIDLALHRFDVTVVDLSDVGLTIAHESALEAGVKITTIQSDLNADPLPAGPWEVITTANYLQRDLYPAMIDALTPGGYLVIVVATMMNLERHTRPGRVFLIEPQELLRLAGDLEIVHHSEAWRENDRHEAHLVAQKP